MPNFDFLAENWDIYSYPWRPNHSFLQVIDNYIFKENMNIFILGATKEFRLKYKNHNITVCDLSQKMIEYNGIGNKKENILVKNWLDLENGNYDLILGDLIFFLLDIDSQIKLFNTIEKILSKEGFFIFRTAFNLENDINLLKKQIDIKNFPDLNNFFNYLTFELVVGKRLKGSEIFEFLKSIDEKISKNFYDNFLKFTPYNTSEIIVLKEKYFLNNLIEKFNILDTISYTHFLSKEVIYVLSKRKLGTKKN